MIKRANTRLNFLWLELTEKCNLECIHCYSDSSPQKAKGNKMGFSEWKNVILEARKVNSDHIQFIGGEPTLYPYLQELIEIAYCNGFEFIEVFTNGVKFSNQQRQVFLKFGVNLAFSIYSLDGNIHDNITSKKGSFNRTISNIKWAIENGLKVRVGIIDLGINSHTISATIEFLKALGVSHVGVDQKRNIGRGRTKGNDDYNGFNELCSECDEGKLCITPSGNIFHCPLSRFWEVGNFFTDGVANSLISKKHSQFYQYYSQRKPQSERYSVMAIGSNCLPNKEPPPRPSHPNNPDETCNPGYSPKSSCFPKYLIPDFFEGCHPRSPEEEKKRRKRRKKRNR